MRSSILGVLFCALLLPISVASAENPLAFEFELAIVHVRGLELTPAKQRELTGASILEAVADWRKAGKLERLTTIRMSAVEKQSASVQIGETVPVVIGRTHMGINRAGGGAPAVQQQVQMEQLGTLVECTGRVTPNGMIEVEVSAEQSRTGRFAASFARPAEATVEPNSTPTVASGPEGFHPGRLTTTAKTTVVGKSGESRILGATCQEGPEGSLATLVVLTSRLVGTAP